MQSPEITNVVCQRIRLSGLVQGVGFRSHVWRLAKGLGLTGWVRNDAQGVEIEVCGRAEVVEQMAQRLHKDAPPMARVDAIKSRYTESVSVSEDFFILDSRGGRAATMIGQDTVVCRDCLSDMFDPEGRRWRYAFTSCTHCGPRYTISHGLPYDRERTSFKSFTPCNKCQAEYSRPADRRLHAETNCCPKCGPQLSMLDAQGNAISGDAIANAYSLLLEGKIVAIKGPGGFHLACDAHNSAAVARLRERKTRPSKPFPVMLANAPSAAGYVQLGVGEPGLLNLPERPIILLKKRNTCEASLPGVAPGIPWLGVMLPIAPVYYLIFHEAAGRPSGMGWLEKAQDLVLMMGSANPSREPLAIGNDEVVQRLAGIADAFLVHDLEIVTRCDDSIACSGLGGLQLIRRARGYAPRALKLPHAGPPILAVGGVNKNTVCITRGDEAFVSQHIGELSNPAACEFFDETVARLLKALEVKPALVAHDFQSDVHSTRFAMDFALQRGIPLLGVQHHHAHIAAVLAEHHVTEPVCAIALDGVGVGSDGKKWGGELLRVDGARFERLGHLLPLKLVGCTHEAPKPWCIASALLHGLGRSEEIEKRFGDQPTVAEVAQRLRSGEKVPETSSMGRLFDAAAALLGINAVSVFRGQAGLLLEGLAEHFGEIEPLSNGWKIDQGCLDLLPLFAALADEKKPERGAAIFHATLAAALTDWLRSEAPEGSTVAAGGGCLQNQVLARSLRARLSGTGLHLIEARRLPPNDGGISLGQAWVAMQYLTN